VFCTRRNYSHLSALNS